MDNNLRISLDQALSTVSSKNAEIANFKKQSHEMVGLIELKNKEIEKLAKEIELKNVEAADLKRIIEKNLKPANGQKEENERLLKKNAYLRKLLTEADESISQLKNDNAIWIDKNKRLSLVFQFTPRLLVFMIFGTF